jgi:GH24 family phage-related lysozyme (muramidase)/uncharacterized protein (DUF2345 family)
MASLGKYSTHLPRAYNLEPEGRRATWDKVYLGFVKDNQDAQFMGRLKVYIPELCGEENDDRSWIIVDYSSPFAGATPVRNVTENPASAQTSYGMWFVPPDVDNQVICMFINGDPNRGIWMGCLFQVNRHRMTPSYPGNSATVAELPAVAGSAAPTSATPRVAAATTEPAPPTQGGPPAGEVAAAQEAAGTANDPVLGPSTYGSHNSYLVNGVATPGGNRFVLSDQPRDTQIRLQTRNNMQLLLHNDRDLAVLMTGSGRSRIELHGNGDIDIYGSGKISVRSAGDLNLHSDANVNINAGAEVQIRSGGDTKLTSVGRMHLYSKSNLMQTSEGETHRASNGHMFDASAQKIHRQSNAGIYDSVNGGDIHQWAFGNVFVRATKEFNLLVNEGIKATSSQGNLSLKSGDQVLIESQGNTQILSESNINQQSAAAINLKSGSSLNLESEGAGNFKTADAANIEVGANLNLTMVPGRVIHITPGILNDIFPAPAASAADSAPAETAVAGEQSRLATAASQVTVTQHIVAYSGDRLGGGRTYRVVTSVGSRVPSAEPAPNRFVESPGYSGTGTVESSDQVSVNFRVGQIEDNQTVPLQTMGFVGAGATVGRATDVSSRIREAAQQGSVLASTAQLAARVPASWQPIIDSAAQANNIPPSLLTALIGLESGGNPTAVSSAGAVGPAQILPSTAADPGYGLPPLPRNALTDPNRSIPWAASYLAALRDRQFNGDIGSAIAAYNWGAGSVLAFSQGSRTMPAETRNYLATLLPALPPQIPQETGEAAASGEEPQRYVGFGYQNNTPVYLSEPVPNYTFKSAAEYTLSDTALLDIKNFETIRGPRPSDPVGQRFRNVCDTTWMIGYGHILEDNDTTVSIDGNDVSIENGITEEQALALLRQDLALVESAVKSAVSNVITQQQYDALVDFAWNIGVDKFRESDVVKFLRDKKYDSVPTEMTRWVFACGLVRAELISRRRANALRFAGIMRAETPVVVEPQIQPSAQAAIVGDYPYLRFANSVINNPANPNGLRQTSSQILNVANAIGQQLGVPLTVVSAYRSPQYNASVGGAPNSAHIQGIAVDISYAGIPGGRQSLVAFALRNGIQRNRIFEYSNFVHIDLRGAALTDQDL